MRVPRSWRVVAAALALAVTSCDTPTDTTPAAVHPSNATVIDGYTIGREKLPSPLPTLTVSGVIGVAGGSITILGHMLTVPAGSVNGPTTFTMDVQPTGLIEVELSAVEFPVIGTPVPVTRFNRPIRLSLNYARSRDRFALRDRGVVIHVDGNDATPVTTFIRRPQNRAVGYLWHFSRYMMASN